MPTLDRRITVRRTVLDVVDFGETTETATDFPVWAGVGDLSAFDVESEGGSFTERLRKWTIRWRADFVAFDTEELSVIDDGETFSVTNIVRQEESGERRRFMMLEGVALP